MLKYRAPPPYFVNVGVELLGVCCGAARTCVCRVEGRG